MIRVISLENENSLIQLICEEHGKDIGLEVKEVREIDWKKIGARLDDQPATDSWKQISRQHGLYVKPTLINQDEVSKVTKRDARKTWFFAHV